MSSAEHGNDHEETTPEGVAAEAAGARAAPDDPKSPVGQKPVTEDPEQLREEIAETREELGDTVEALAQKADVKGQVKEKVQERKDRLREGQAQAQAKLGEVGQQAKENPTPIAAVAGGLIALLLLLVLLKRRS